MVNLLENKKVLSVHDYLVLFLVGSLFYIDFIPSFRAIEVRGTQFLYMSVVNLLIGLLFFAFPKFLNTEIISIFKKSTFVKFYGIFIALCFVSFIGSRNSSIWVVALSQLLILSITIFNFCLLLFDRKHLFYHICFIIGAFTLVKSFNEIIFFISQKKTVSFAQAVSSLKGNTGNINIFSASLNVKMPFLILGIMHFQNWKKWILMIATTLSVFIIYILDSRATFLALLIESIVILIFLIWKSSDRKNLQTNILSTIAPIVAGILLGMFALTQGAKTEIAVSKQSANVITSNVGNIELKDGGSVNQRLNYWSNALKIIKKNPIVGIGLGNWCVESILYEKYQTNGMMISVHAHNDFLQIASETGLINGVVFVSLFIILLIFNVKKIIKNKNELTKNIAFLCLLILIAYSVDSFFNFPLYRPTVQLGLCFLIVFSLLNTEKNEDQPKTEKNVFQWNQILLSVFLLFNLFTIFFSYCNFMSLRLSNEIILDGLKDKRYLTSDFIIENYPKYPNVMFNSQPFAEYVGIYMIEEKKYDLAHKYLNTAAKINPYVGRAEWYKYRMAKENNKLDSAYVYAKQAFYIKPRNNEYFNTIIYMANQFKDTSEMLKTHNIYHKMLKSPKDFIETSSGLHNSNYSKKGLIKFINIGLKEFPNDSLLLRRKRIFEYEEKTNVLNKGIVTPQVTNLANENTFEKELKKAEDNGAKFLALAVKLGEENQFLESITAYKKVLETQPTNLSVKQNIGVSYYKIGQFKNAIEWLEQTTAAAKGYEDGKSEYVIAACYVSLKENVKACEYLNVAVSKNYTNAVELQKQICK